jgi:hypothetical protein
MTLMLLRMTRKTQRHEIRIFLTVRYRLLSCDHAESQISNALRSQIYRPGSVHLAL